MAPRNNKTAQAETKNVPALRVANAVALPDFLQGYKGPTGTEGIESEDVTLPRIKIGQDMSAEVQEGRLERGDLFLNVTGEKMVGPGQKLDVVLLARNKEYILWRPRKDNGGGILARARPVQTKDGVRYAWDKPNTTFDVKVEGKVAVKWKTKTYIDEDGLGDWGSEIPGDKDSGIAATAHHNYVAFLPSLGALAAFSLSRTAAGKAKDLNAILKQRTDVPMWGRKFTVETFKDHRDENEFFNIKFLPNGFVERADFTGYDAMAKGFQNKGFIVDQSDDDAGEGKGDGKL